MRGAPVILDAEGNPIGAPAAVRRASAAHDAGDRFSRALANWNPWPGSADADLLGELKTIVGRSRDITRNHGFASGAMQTHLDNAIGAGLRMSAKPDWRVLGISPEVAQEWARDTEAKFRDWADDPRFYCDAARRSPLSGLFGLAYRSYLVNGEILAVMRWLPDRGHRFATAVQLIEPDRLANPNDGPDEDLRRAGVELDEFGAPIAYHIRNRHPGDWLGMGTVAPAWERVVRETPWGRPVCIHAFNPERIGQTRGKPIVAPILEALKVLDHYERTELQAAIVNAMFAAFIESPYDPNLVAQGVGATEDIGVYQQLRAEFHNERNIKLDGVKIPHLFPGEKFTFAAANRPSSSFAAFEEAVLRKIAAGLNLTYEQVSRDYSKTNYSSARAAMLESWKFFSGQRSFIATYLAKSIYVCWLEEAIDNGTVELPPGAPDFYEATAAWTRCKWIGPAMGWIDPLKEADAVGRRLELNVSTLEDECAALGLDWEDVLEQRARELRRMQELGLGPAPPAPAGRVYPSDQETTRSADR